MGYPTGRGKVKSCCCGAIGKGCCYPAFLFLFTGDQSTETYRFRFHGDYDFSFNDDIVGCGGDTRAYLFLPGPAPNYGHSLYSTIRSIYGIDCVKVTTLPESVQSICKDCSCPPAVLTCPTQDNFPFTVQIYGVCSQARNTELRVTSPYLPPQNIFQDPDRLAYISSSEGLPFPWPCCFSNCCSDSDPLADGPVIGLSFGIVGWCPDCRDVFPRNGYPGQFNDWTCYNDGLDFAVFGLPGDVLSMPVSSSSDLGVTVSIDIASGTTTLYRIGVISLSMCPDGIVMGDFGSNGPITVEFGSERRVCRVDFLTGLTGPPFGYAGAMMQIDAWDDDGNHSTVTEEFASYTYPGACDPTYGDPAGGVNTGIVVDSRNGRSITKIEFQLVNNKPDESPWGILIGGLCICSQSIEA